MKELNTFTSKIKKKELKSSKVNQKKAQGRK